MPGRRWARARSRGTFADGSVDIIREDKNAPTVNSVPEAPKQSAGGSPLGACGAEKCESSVSSLSGDVTEGGDAVCPSRKRVHSANRLTADEPASVPTSQEDACAFHSPRSLPGDSSDAGGLSTRAPPEQEAGHLHTGTLSTAEATHAPPESLDEGEIFASRSPLQPVGLDEQHSASSGSQGTQKQRAEKQGDQEVVKLPAQQQLLVLDPQQVLPGEQRECTPGGVSLIVTRTSPPSESEGEWIRVEEFKRDAAEEASASQKTCADVLSSVTGLPECTLPSAPRQQASLHPVCIGTASQSEEGACTYTCSTEPLKGMAYGMLSDTTGWDASSPSLAQANQKSALDRLSVYVMSLANTLAGRLFAEQQQGDPANYEPGDTSTEVNAFHEKLSEASPQARQSNGRRDRLLQAVRSWHRCILEVYGGAIEDITKVALQVLPAHATDDRSERQFLLVQGLFEVFCLYRAHFLSPPEELLQAETLHHQWKLRKKYSIDATQASSTEETSLPPVFVLSERYGDLAVDRRRGLPTSVRLALYGFVSLALKVVRALQLLLEVNALRSGGEGPRFALCLRLELVKLLLKLILHALTPFAFYCEEQSVYQALAVQKEKQKILESERMRPSYGRRTGRKIPPLPSTARQFPNDGQAAFAAAAKEQLPRQWIVLVIEWLFNELRAISSPSRMVATWHHLRLTPWRLWIFKAGCHPAYPHRPVLAEVLYHLRPFIHLYLLKRAKTTKSWTSWLAAMLVEANSVSLLHSCPEVMERLSPIEAAELHRRLTGLPYALLRPPFFDKFLARPCEAIDFVVSRVPLLNHFNVLDAFLAYRDLYFISSNT
ncbi:hypothetical protein, conserved [Eimeria tenella]|uniref:Peroxisomal membrane protein PEX16 n=1 Tax=Eimeria tenella TaxID=5802 RepID=U6KY91_EIMTE|nr:hypothetical protein, conserved [Eimeria tenella]CDJ40440.1 hypothetical protein, conserved [Eimeria tenella]|eukprot:XP_013231190.1 hypothetical protein, conserved [Eimeria tenella]